MTPDMLRNTWRELGSSLDIYRATKVASGIEPRRSGLASDALTTRLPLVSKDDNAAYVLCSRIMARATIYLLKDTFGDRLISRFGPVNWPPRSCDLTPLDYFLWGYVKSLVYADKPQTLDYLEDNIRLIIADIRPQMLEKVIENWTSRLDYIRASRGSHMPEVIFKISPAGGATEYQLLRRSINRQVANVDAKNDANLAVSPTFRYVSIEPPL
ncbi:uncharacterized protein TNCV_4118581 [Trichonephila clavipes]|nr:uncharacterized protein TNCV_4118581 [Trichonephila clavipes]